MNTFLYKKQVDWSLLKEGFALPVSIHPLLRASSALRLEIGEKRQITILIDGKSFTAQLINNNFDRQKYPDHKEIIQVRYSPKSEISQFFRLVYERSFKSIVSQKALKEKRLAVSSDTPEYFCLYATDVPGVFYGETITAAEVTEAIKDIHLCDEIEWENAINGIDTTASIINRTRTVKIRHLDKSIADGLKSLYNNCCQVCGCSFKIPYGSNLIHAHHIKSFTMSLNNNPENIMILCPNHHYIVHDVKPEFDLEKLSFHYQNGLIEPLKLNYHLGKYWL